MNDRDLLELAAKAAEIEVFWHTGWNLLVIQRTHRAWNPLTDDGDALRLAVALDMDVFIRSGGETEAVAPMGKPQTVEHGSDPHSATRRAIVRAAAEIGRTGVQR